MVAELLGHVPVVEVDGDGPQLVGGQHRFEVLGAVVDMAADGRAGDDTAALQVVGQAVRPVLELGVGQAAVPEGLAADDHRLPLVAQLVDHAFPQVGQLMGHGPFIAPTAPCRSLRRTSGGPARRRSGPARRRGPRGRARPSWARGDAASGRLKRSGRAARRRSASRRPDGPVPRRSLGPGAGGGWRSSGGRGPPRRERLRRSGRRPRPGGHGRPPRPPAQRRPRPRRPGRR